MEAILHMELLLHTMALSAPASTFMLPMLPRPALANWRAARRLMRTSKRGPSSMSLGGSCGGVVSRLCSMSTWVYRVFFYSCSLSTQVTPTSAQVAETD